MPDRKQLKIGDQIRLLKVPDLDMKQMEEDCSKGVEEPDFTVKVLRHLLSTHPVVTITQIDADGRPWFDCELKNDQDEVVYHSIMILDDDSWEYTDFK